MSLPVRWSPLAEHDVLHMPYKTAERVCAAVLAFARDGSGVVERIGPDAGPAAPLRFFVRARGGFALVELGLDHVEVYRMHAYAAPRRDLPLLDKPRRIPSSPPPPPVSG